MSVHANAAATPVVHGMEVFHFPGSLVGQTAATHVLRAMLTTFPTHRDRGVKEADFAMLRWTEMPAILAEVEFLTNPTQLVFLADPENQHLLAVAIANGIDALG